jgi:hypothetical protein
MAHCAGAKEFSGSCGFLAHLGVKTIHPTGPQESSLAPTGPSQVALHWFRAGFACATTVQDLLWL